MRSFSSSTRAKCVMQVEERRSYFTEFKKVVSPRALWVILSVVVAFLLPFQDCTKGKFEFTDKEILLLRCGIAFCNSAMRIYQTLILLQKLSSFLILPPAVLLPIFLSFLCCPGLVCMDGVKYGVNI